MLSAKSGVESAAYSPVYDTRKGKPSVIIRWTITTPAVNLRLDLWQESDSIHENKKKTKVTKP